ncbi:5-oxoprolinase subunit PxpA [Lacibacter sp. MH-610]|uniref:5-oxoprolinase subunit PxpA n=1 Tax=Lacibacter sp. MH-610 TaxID=3020883 RepID=UPI003892A352
MQVDLNCDLGEGMNTDEQIIPLISSANIACGFHAGDESTMKRTIELCLQHGVAIGAHPSWPDRENFGRTEMNLSEQELYDCVIDQLQILQTIAAKFNTKLHHVKPHGALYNQSAKNKIIASAIAKAVKDFDSSLILFGLSGSISLKEAELLGLKTAHEVFADRTYRNDGSLTPRSQPNALIEDEDKAVQQALQMIQQGTLTAISGKVIPLKADTVCLHGDGKHALAFCTKIHEQLKNHGIVIQAI